ncbi:hexitol phosphatase HxpB [Testudinibacter sp. TR-2022]|uniref:hexitol phosphatase HxpB n=1 Tax=Testudinibacter sp. TR-2022 TaxID=2585029 RepID=UPI00111B4CB9|nr:hexitol phosphatase HxpB [Testudinibacter sp. TR-2022]TNH03676.1 hexitol phosphatase HxpB [Pasteurellaceae bacterium Phil31]TNH08064.1 hexitol phosphatase HxpB [Testudinibacter sp. TR-2022]TNH10276.1 hexitol phosphatase HxpB [Testudinibacter sp. TR-2022]TNH12159.1 hexitol phosphatase HxpB [Testudinibacter sp. TR-2022]TNH16108.1 hexitol phosphatase HxpB [Testudinibacter sp. TR-2022]
MTRIKAVIFDMDGVLIDSEPLWQQAGIHYFNQLGLPVSAEDMRQMVGVPSKEVIRKLYQQYGAADLSVEQATEQYCRSAIDLILDKQPLMDGVKPLLVRLRQHNLKIAVASASPRELLESITQKCGIRDYFSAIASATELPYNKPHPAVYLHAAQQLGVEPHFAVGIEDSVVGMTAVKAASMCCIAVPSAHEEDDPRWALADYKLSSLNQIDDRLLTGLIQHR